MRLGGYFDRDIKVVLTEADQDEPSLGKRARSRLTSFLPGDKLAIRNPLSDNVWLEEFVDGIDYPHMLIVTDAQWRKYTKKIPDPGLNVMFVGFFPIIYWDDDSTRNEYWKQLIVDCDVYRPVRIPGQPTRWVKEDHIKLIVADEIDNDDRRNHDNTVISIFADEQSEAEFDRWMMETIYNRSKSDNGEHSSQAQDPVPVQVDDFNVELFAADITPADNMDNPILVDRLSVGTGYFTRTTDALVIGQDYTLQQLKSAARQGKLRDPEKGELPDGLYTFLGYESMGSPRRYLKDVKTWTPILKYSVIRAKFKRSK